MVKYFTINAEKYSIRCKAYYDDWKTPQTVVLCGHGFGGHKDNTAAERFAGRLLEKNKHALVLCFNWPCHGDDARKKLQLSECDLYLRLVLEHLRQAWPDARLLGYATSFGGYLFLRRLAGGDNPFARVALRCPAVNMYEVMTGALMTEDARAKLAKGKPVPVGFDRKVEITREFLDELQAADLLQEDFLDVAENILIVHGVKDEIVSFDTVRQFADDNLIEFLPVEGADHRFLDPRKMDLAIAQILNFFSLR